MQNSSKHTCLFPTTLTDILIRDKLKNNTFFKRNCETSTSTIYNWKKHTVCTVLIFVMTHTPSKMLFIYHLIPLMAFSEKYKSKIKISCSLSSSLRLLRWHNFGFLKRKNDFIWIIKIIVKVEIKENGIIFVNRESEEARERESFFADPPCLLLAHRISPSRSIRLADEFIQSLSFLFSSIDRP